MDEIKRPGGAWQDDDGEPLPVGTLTRKKFTGRPAGQRGVFHRAVLRVTGVSEPDADGDRTLLYEKVETESIPYGVPA